MILQKLVFSIMSCQKMNVPFVLGYMKRIQNQLSGWNVQMKMVMFGATPIAWRFVMEHTYAMLVEHF